MTRADALTGDDRRAPDHAPVRSVARVLICHERSSARLALSHVVEKAIISVSDIVCVADGFDLADAFMAKPADLVLIGHQLGRVGGLQATELLLGLVPSAVVVAVGSPDSGITLATAVARGARGLMVWDPDERRYPGPGGIGWTAPPLGREPQPGRDIYGLTDRELQILREMSRGRSNAQIGLEMFLSEDSVKRHARMLYRKLGARDRAHAVALGIRSNLVA